MFFLQSQTIQKGTETLFQYEVLGLFTIILLWVIYYLEKQRKAKDSDRDIKIAKLEERLDNQQRDHEHFLRTEYLKATQVNEKCLEVLDEVKDILLKVINK